MTDLSVLHPAIDQDDEQAASKLLPLVYDELRKLAAEKLAYERPGQTLQATALVHEAYLRLVGNFAGQKNGRPILGLRPGLAASRDGRRRSQREKLRIALTSAAKFRRTEDVTDQEEKPIAARPRQSSTLTPFPTSGPIAESIWNEPGRSRSRLPWSGQPHERVSAHVR